MRIREEGWIIKESGFEKREKDIEDKTSGFFQQIQGLREIHWYVDREKELNGRITELELMITIFEERLIGCNCDRGSSEGETSEEEESSEPSIE
jgi:cell fate (sporulation/competence/biofilm development) regulator YlbF (YheA/YmcA/DUF963 family)